MHFQVSASMLGRLVEEEDHVVAMIYSGGRGGLAFDKRTEEVHDRFDSVVHRLERMGVPAVKTSDSAFVAREYGVGGGEAELPALVVFEGEVPVPFVQGEDGDMLSVDDIHSWVNEVVERKEMPVVSAEVCAKQRIIQFT